MQVHIAPEFAGCFPDLRRSAAAVRYVVWCAGLLSLLALPVLSFVLPQWQVGILPQATALLPETPVQAVPPVPAPTPAPAPEAAPLPPPNPVASSIVKAD